jgi:hypothetical protein
VRDHADDPPGRADAPAACRPGERTAALVALALAVAIAVVLLLLAVSGARDAAPPPRVAAAQPGPATTDGTAPRPSERAEEAVRPAVPDEPAQAEPGGASPGVDGDAGSLAGAGRSDRAFGFSVEPVTEDVAGAPVSADEVSSEAGGAQGDGGTGNGEGGGNGDGRGPGEFMGIPATGKDIVFVIDRSGSMAYEGRIHHVKLELRRAIESLGPENRFLVILFNSEATPLGGDRLVAADERGKRAAYAQLARINDSSTGGDTDPSSAMRLALRLAPDTVFLMTDGEFEPQPTDEVIEALNRDREVTINTIAFHVAGSEEVLRGIAERNGGRYRFVPPPRPRD